MGKPTLHQVSVAGKSPEQKLELIAKMYERMTGKPATAADLVQAAATLGAKVPNSPMEASAASKTPAPGQPAAT